MSFAENPYQLMRLQRRSSFRPEDIKEYGVERFLAEQAARGELPAPNFILTEEEIQLIDLLLAEERRTDNAA